MSKCSEPGAAICPPWLKRPPPIETAPAQARSAAWISSAERGRRTSATSIGLSCETSLTTGFAARARGARAERPEAAAAWRSLRRPGIIEARRCSHLPHERRRKLLHCLHPALRHRRLGFGAQELEHFRHARLAEGAQSPQVGPADADGARAHGERFAHVGAAAEAAVDEHRHLSFRRI